MTKQIVFRIVAGLVLLAVIGSIAVLAFNAGVTRGVAANLAEAGEIRNAFPQRFAMPYAGHRLFLAPFGLLRCLVPLFLLFLAFGAFRALLWGRHGMRHGPWHGPWNQEGLPPMFDEWHRRAHEKTDAPPPAGE